MAGTHPNPLSVDQTWSYLEAGINHLLNHLDEGILYPRYMGLYTGVYNYCTSSRMNAGFSAEPLTSAISGRGANLLGSDLYRKLTKHLQGHLAKIRAESGGFMDETLLNFYTRQWERYTKASKYINHIFSYLNRHWVKREIDEGHKGVYDIYTLALVSWREHLFTHLEHNVMEAVLKIVERQRNGETIEASLIQNVIKSFVSLGLDDADSTKSTLDVYKKYFEVPFVAATEVYFKTESEKFVSENSVTDYMKKAEMRLKEEEDRVQVYLHPSTAKPLILTCENVLVKNHMEVIWEEFQHLLDYDKQEDLFRMYSLLSRIPEGLDPLRTRFEAHVRRAGLAAIEKIADQGSDQIEPKTYVDALLEVHKKYNDLVTSAFRGEAGFVASLDKACREFVNRNKICKASTSKSPEFLARFCDSLLRKSSKNPEEGDLEDLLNSIMTVFKYVEDKDVFQKFYSKMLAKRLVWANSASEDAEANMITKLKEACGYEYTSKLQRMFTDVNVSKDLNESFSERMNTTHDGADLNVDFSIMILSTAAWPLQPPASGFNIPEDVVKTYDRFQKFYQSKHSGRKLNWLFQLSKAELKANYLSNKPGGPKSGYTFQTSTYQMGILLQYNNALSYTREELRTSTGLTPEVLEGTLGVLEKLKILIQNGDKLELNMDFKSKKIRVNLNMPVKSELKVESDETHKTIEEDRKLLMQAAIVRIMKTRKVMKHVALMQEVIQQLKSRFQPKIPDIKKCIDVLLEKEYLERVEGQKDTFSYVA